MLGRWLEEEEEELKCFFVFLSSLAPSSDMSKSDMTEASDSVNDPVDLDDLSREVLGDVFDVDDGDVFLDDGDVFLDDGDVLVDDGDVLVDLVKDPGDDDDALLTGGGDGRLLPLPPLPPLPLPCFAAANPSNLFCSFLLLLDSSISTSRNTLLGVSSSITLRPPP